jgi:hypothetical protein
MSTPRPFDPTPGRPGPFSPAELDGADDPNPRDEGDVLRVARELEALAAAPTGRPSAEFADRVMRSIAAEPLPAPARAARAAVRHHAGRDLVGAFRDAFRVFFGHGFPVAVRAQALALVLVVVALAAGSGMATAGAVGWIRESRLVPMPGLLAPTPTPTATPTSAPPATPVSPDATGTPDGQPEPQGETGDGILGQTGPDGTSEPWGSGDSNGGSGFGPRDGTGESSTPSGVGDGGSQPTPTANGGSEAGGQATSNPTSTTDGASSPTATPREGSSSRATGSATPSWTPRP